MHDLSACLISQLERWFLALEPSMVHSGTYVDSGALKINAIPVTLLHLSSTLNALLFILHSTWRFAEPKATVADCCKEVYAAMNNYLVRLYMCALVLICAGEFTGQQPVVDSLQKGIPLTNEQLQQKKVDGRLRKARADLCLLAGSPSDAFEHYKAAMELSKVRKGRFMSFGPLTLSLFAANNWMSMS